MNLQERLRWWSRAARSRGADLKKAQGRREHFDKVGRQAHAEWVKARKAKMPSKAQAAKDRARRAHKKSAYWDEQVDDLRDGYKKAVSRRESVKKHIATRKHQSASAAGFTSPAKPWNPMHRPVCGWFVPILDQAREKGWRGIVVSGVRTPSESVGLCRAMCGSDSCPGRCAGASSNHNATTCARPQGAIDVSDYYNFAAIMRQMGEPLKNRLPIDRVHFSASGA